MLPYDTPVSGPYAAGISPGRVRASCCGVTRGAPTVHSAAGAVPGTGDGQGAMVGGGELAAVGVLACALVSAAAGLLVRSRRQGAAGTALAVMLGALAVWNLGYAGELLATTPSWRLLLGDLKYVGICTLAPAWAVFILCWTGRGHRVTRRLLLALAVEPLVVLVLLAVPATHDLVRFLPAADPLDGEVVTGPLFWVHSAYVQLLMLPALGLFVGSLLRRSRVYWLQAGALTVAAVLPWLANLLFTLSVGPFGRFDLTPVAFVVTGAVLTWGLLSQHLLRLTSLARSLLVDRMTDGVLVLDAYGHVTDANPALRALLDPPSPHLLGCLAADVLPPEVLADGGAEVRLGPQGRTYEVTGTTLPGRGGQPAGRLLVLRDVHERTELAQQLRALLAEQARITEQLSSSLRPPRLPEVPGLQLAACFRPAGSGSEIGGDFYDVFPVGDEWAFALGDVSGKGAQAAATTAHARYTLRTLVLAGARPAAALERLHGLVVGELDDETYLTVAHGRVRPGEGGTRIVLALGGHPQPLVVRADGTVEPVGVPGAAIGLLEEVSACDTEVLLHPGDTLFVFTDGVSEARTGRALFGEQRLAEVLARCSALEAGAFADTVLAEVVSLRASGPDDDIAMLVLRCPAAVGRSVPPSVVLGAGTR